VKDMVELSVVNLFYEIISNENELAQIKLLCLSGLDWLFKRSAEAKIIFE
jgi:hypothetical protein